MVVFRKIYIIMNIESFFNTFLLYLNLLIYYIYIKKKKIVVKYLSYKRKVV